MYHSRRRGYIYWERSLLLLGGSQGLGEVLLDVVNVLDADRHTDHVGQGATGNLLRLAQLLVRCGRRVDHQGLGVAYVGPPTRAI